MINNKYGKVYITKTPDCGENLGGYYCQVYADENFENEIDDFVIHTDDCNCNDDKDVDRFIQNYAKMYQ